MRLFILDTGIAGLYLDRKQGVFERAAAEVAYGRIRYEFKSNGRPIEQNDITISTIAFSPNNITVVSMDGDLSAIPGLTVENWAEAV